MYYETPLSVSITPVDDISFSVFAGYCARYRKLGPREMAGHKHKPWYRIKWFSDDDTHEERRLIVKLDLLIVPYAFLSYWTKYIDQANLSE